MIGFAGISNLIWFVKILISFFTKSSCVSFDMNSIIYYIISICMSNKIILMIQNISLIMQNIFSTRKIKYIINILSSIIGENNYKDVQDARSRDIKIGSSSRAYSIVIMVWILLFIMMFVFVFKKTMLREDDLALIVHVIGMCLGIITQVARFEFGAKVENR